MMNYKGFVALVSDVKSREEFVIFRPSSMPITEVMEDKNELDKKTIE